MDKGKLGKKKRIEVSYSVNGCECAHWLLSKNKKSLIDEEQIYLEQANTSLIQPDTLFKGTNLPVIVSLEGQFYSKEGYPKNYNPAKGSPDPARVFRYTKLKIMSLGSSL